MKVILLHEVPGLGKPGDVKDVANGYARNYLLPRQLVTAATGMEMERLRERVAAAQRRVQKQRATNEELAAQLEAVTLTFAVRVGQGQSPLRLGDQPEYSRCFAGARGSQR